MANVGRKSVVVAWLVAAAAIAASCSPGEGPESIPLPTSPDTTTTTSTTTTTTTVPPTTLVPPRYEATIRRTTDGVPHISGETTSDVAYGQGWVSGEDHTCALADQVTKIRGERSRHLGPGAEGENLDSDFAWKAIDIMGIAATDFENASPLVVDQFEAFTTGWNDQLIDVGVADVPGWCAGEDWVRPLEPVEIYAYARSVALFASSARLTDFIAEAQPPEASADAAAQPSGFASTAGLPSTSPAPSPAPDVDLFGDALAAAGLADGERTELASNAWAIGGDRISGDSGSLLVGNPHFPWEGELRFAEAHLTVPGEFDVYGANLLGVPGIGIGFTDTMAWTHTVSAGSRMTGYLLALDPVSPTSYLVDGVSVPMTSRDATIEILRADGTIDTETRTLWRSEYGPIIDFPGIGWSAANVVSIRDANIDNDEFVEQYARMPRVGSIAELRELTEQYQGVPLFNTVAVDDDGTAWYADTSATPNLSDAAEQAYIGALFTDLLTQIAYEQGFILLDGSNGIFRWEDVAGARDPGLVPYVEMPEVERTDHVFNANDSFWVPNATITLDGPFSIMHGEQGTPLTMRTRQNVAVLDPANATGLAGDDGLFDGEEVRTAAFDNEGRTAVLLRSAVVDACRAQPIVEGPELLAPDGSVSLPAASVDLAPACAVLARWDDTYDLDRAGPMIWREMMDRFEPLDFQTAGPLFSDGFDPARPTVTPAVPTDDPGALLEALGRAVQTVTEAGFDVDTTLGASQFTERSETRIPIHGGTGVDGVTNIVTWRDRSSSSEPAPERGEAVALGTSLRGEGYRINFGTSFVMTVDFTGDDVEAWALLVYGQTGDRTSELFDSQMVAFSEKQWRRVAFSDEAIEADADLVTSVVVRP